MMVMWNMPHHHFYFRKQEGIRNMAKEKLHAVDNTESGQIAQLREVFPAFKRLSLAGEGVEVKPFSFYQIVEALSAISPIFTAINIQGDSQWGIFAALASNAEALIELQKLATGKDEEFLKTLSASEGTRLVNTIIELNKDFFMEELPQLLTSLLGTSTAEKAEVAETSN